MDILRAHLCEYLFQLAMSVAPKGYVASFDEIVARQRSALEFTQRDPCYKLLGSVTHDEISAALADLVLPLK